MDCFSNLIGIKGECGTPTAPDSDLYVQDLTGMSVEAADRTIHSQHQSGFEFMQEKIDFSAKYVKQTIRTYLQNKFTLTSSRANGVVGSYKDNQVALASDAGYLRGIQVKIDKQPYASLFISSVSIQGQTTQSENIVIWDLIQNKLLDTIAISAVDGEIISADVYKEYPTNGQRLNLFIGTDAEVYKNEISCSGCGRGNSFARFYGKKILSASDKTADNLRNGTGAGGISINYSVNCSFEPLLCSMRNLVAMPTLFRVGYEIVKEMKYSKRFNSLVNLYTLDHTELMEMYDKEFRQQMGEVLENIDVTNSCFRCRKRSRVKVALP